MRKASIIHRVSLAHGAHFGKTEIALPRYDDA
jgi:hypothetical protein